MKNYLLIAAIGFAVTSLTSCASITRDQVRTDRAAYNAIAPDYLRYVNNDPSLSIQQKSSKKALVDQWEQRLREMEEKAR